MRNCDLGHSVRGLEKQGKAGWAGKEMWQRKLLCVFNSLFTLLCSLARARARALPVCVPVSGSVCIFAALRIINS